MKQLKITDLNSWEMNAPSIEPSAFFQQRLKRLEAFDLQSYERSKELLIDAFCEEAIQSFSKLKIWKGAGLEGDAVIGSVDYLIAERKRYLEAPLLCVAEAKKDDFEQGLAQCLVEMQACQWLPIYLSIKKGRMHAPFFRFMPVTVLDFSRNLSLCFLGC